MQSDLRSASSFPPGLRGTGEEFAIRQIPLQSLTDGEEKKGLTAGYLQLNFALTRRKRMFPNFYDWDEYAIQGRIDEKNIVIDLWKARRCLWDGVLDVILVIVDRWRHLDWPAIMPRAIVFPEAAYCLFLVYPHSWRASIVVLSTVLFVLCRSIPDRDRLHVVWGFSKVKHPFLQTAYL